MKLKQTKNYCKCGCGQEIPFQKHHKYYGIPTYIRGHNPQKNNKKIELICKTCGNKFYRSPSKIGKYCSKSCYAKTLKGNIPWNKGLTKETSMGVKKISDSKIGKKRPLFSENWKRNIGKTMLGNKYCKGVKQSQETIQKRIASRTIWSTKTQRRNQRNARIEYIKKYCNGISPRIGKCEKQILDNLEECFNYNILRQYKINGYFLDGYCPALNLAIEVDEKAHTHKLIKDLEREDEIKKGLNCQFLRLKEKALK